MLEALAPARFPNVIDAAEPVTRESDPGDYSLGVDPIRARIEAMARRDQ